MCLQAIRFGVLAVSMVTMVLVGCQHHEDPHTATHQPAQTYHLAVTNPSTGTMNEYVRTGTVISDQRLALSSQLTGYIREIRVQEGEPIRQGQVLVRLESSLVEGAIQQGQAGLTAAQAIAHDATTDVRHVEQLFAQGHVSDNELRKARLRHDTALQTLQQAQVVLNTALAQRQYSEIRSPLTGVVVDRHLRVGDLVVPNTPILTLETNQQWLFSTSLPAQQLAHVTVGMPVAIALDASDQSMTGHVARIVPSQDALTHTYQVKISLPPAVKTAKPIVSGMFGRAIFALGHSTDIVIPKSALIERGGLQGVFVINNQHQAQFRWLRLGREWPQQVAVNAGLRADEHIVAAPNAQLRDGDRVLPLTPAR